jgi:integrase/recombinase XerD
MLSTHVDRYVALRRTLGFKLHDTARHLHAFARFAAARSDTHIRASTAVAWAAEAPSPNARHVRLRDVVQFARFLRAEDAAHEVPPSTLFSASKARPLPYIYTPEEVARIVAAAGRLRRTYPLRREVYATLLGLIAATGRATEFYWSDGQSSERAGSFPCIQLWRTRLAVISISATGWR